jgi:hypothetical protein
MLHLTGQSLSYVSLSYIVHTQAHTRFSEHRSLLSKDDIQLFPQPFLTLGKYALEAYTQVCIMDVHTVCKSHSNFLFYVHTHPTVIIIEKKKV